MQKFVEIDMTKDVKSEVYRVFDGFTVEVFVPDDFPPEPVSPPGWLFDRYGRQTEVLHVCPPEAYVQKIEELFNVTVDRNNVLDNYLATSDVVFVLYFDEIVLGVANWCSQTISVLNNNNGYMETLDEEMLEEFRKRAQVNS